MRKLMELVRRFTNWCSAHKVVTAVFVAVILLSVPLHYSFADGELFTKFVANPFDTTILMLAGVMQLIAGGIGKLSLLLIQMVVIPVLGYNGFYDSHITNLGWSLVRDVVNMFVVVVLMVIAIMTIVGYSAANWTQQLPKLFIAIVLVNFSKLICGVLIDASQVVMFTFVNAIVSIAAGNFASMFSMNTFGQFGGDFIEKVNASGDGLGAAEFFLAAYLQIIFTLAVLVVLLLLAIAFVWRIVILWVLIIMSPLAFFMIGVKDIFHSADSSYKKWWEQFTSALTFGPMMAFFLWLALAASSGSNMAQTEDFPMPESQEDAGIPLEMFSLDNFLGMFIAVAILMAGLQQSSNAASSIGGFASKMISPDMGKSVLKGLARSPFAAAGGFKKERAWVNDKAQKAGAYAPGLSKSVGGALAKAGTAAAGVKGFGWAGNAAAAVGGNMVKGAKHTMKDEAKLGGEQFKERTDDQVAKIDAAAAKGGNAFKSLPTDEKNAYLKSFGTDLKRREKFIKNQTDAYAAAEKAKVAESDPDKEKKFKAIEKNAATLAMADHDKVWKDSKDFLDKGGKDLMDDTEKDRFQDSKFANMHLLENDGERKKVWDASEKEGRANINTLSTASIKDPATLAFYKKQVSRRDDKGRDISVWDDIVSNGKGTIQQRDAMIGTITAESIRDTATRKQSLGTLVRAGAISKTDADGVGTTRRDAVREAVKSSVPADYGAKVYGSAASSLLNGTIDDAGIETMVDPNNVLGDSFISTMKQAATDPQSAEYQRGVAMLEADSKSVRHLDGAIGDTANAASALATSKVNLEAVKKLQSASSSGGDDGARAAVALKTMERAVHAEMGRTDLSDDRKKTLKRVADELGTGDRYAQRSGGGAPASVVAAAGAAVGAAVAAPAPAPAPARTSTPPVITQIRGPGTAPANASVPRPVVPVRRPPPSSGGGSGAGSAPAAPAASAPAPSRIDSRYTSTPSAGQAAQAEYNERYAGVNPYDDSPNGEYNTGAASARYDQARTARRDAAAEAAVRVANKNTPPAGGAGTP